MLYHNRILQTLTNYILHTELVSDAATASSLIAHWLPLPMLELVSQIEVIAKVHSPSHRNALNNVLFVPAGFAQHSVRRVFFGSIYKPGFHNLASLSSLFVSGFTDCQAQRVTLEKYQKSKYQ